MYKVNPKNWSKYFAFKVSKQILFSPARFWELNYVQPIHNIKTNKYSTSIRGPNIWNGFLSPKGKQIATLHIFKAITKSRLHFLENEIIFF